MSLNSENISVSRPQSNNVSNTLNSKKTPPKAGNLGTNAVNKETAGDVLKVARLSVEVLFQSDKLTNATAVIDITRNSVQWLETSYELVSGILLNPLQNKLADIGSTDFDFDQFLKIVSGLVKLGNIPLGMVLKTAEVNNGLFNILNDHFSEISSNLGAARTCLAANKALEKKAAPYLDKHEKILILMGKIESLSALSSIGAKKLNLVDLSVGLSLVSASVRLLIFFLEKTAVNQCELFELVKAKSELTLKIHLETLPAAFLETNIGKTSDIADCKRMCDEIRQLIQENLAALRTSDNDDLGNQLRYYEESMNELFQAYGMDVEDFNNEMETLSEDCIPLRQHREAMQTQGTALLEHHLDFLDHQENKLNLILKEYAKKINSLDFNNYIKNDFDKAFAAINLAREQSQSYLSDLRPQKYGAIPFEFMSLEEQTVTYKEVVKLSSEEAQLKLIKLVKFACRE